MTKHQEFLSPRHERGTGLTSNKKYLKTNTSVSQSIADDKMFKTIGSKHGDEDVVFVSVKKTTKVVG